MSEDAAFEREIDTFLDSPEMQPSLAFVRLWMTLAGDVSRLGSTASDLPTNRRAYVRAVLAYVEGLTYGVKQLALGGLVADNSAAERALLLEETFDLDDRGRATSRPAFLRLDRNIRFAFQMYAKASGVSYALPAGESGWNQLLCAIRIRNRLMHPKSIEDLEISEGELTSAREAFEWISKKHREMLRSIILSKLIATGLTEFEAEQSLSNAPFSF